MPIYEFECLQCHRTFDKLMKPSDPNPGCSECGSRKVEKLFSVFGCKCQGSFTSSAPAHNCKGCSSHNCGSCH